LACSLISANKVHVSVDVNLGHPAHTAGHHQKEHNSVFPSEEHATPKQFTPEGHEIISEADFDSAVSSAPSATLTNAAVQSGRWLKHFGKKWSATDMTRRMRTFKNNLLEVVAHNHNPHRSYDRALNQYSDMDAVEFKKKIATAKFSKAPTPAERAAAKKKHMHATGRKPTESELDQAELDEAEVNDATVNEEEEFEIDSALPKGMVTYPVRAIDIDPILGDSGKTTQAHHDARQNNPLAIQTGDAQTEGIDWVAAGNVVAPRDQAQCGACWAFSSSDAISAAWSIKTRTSPQLLAPQYLVDCNTHMDWSFWLKSNSGCGGGFPQVTFDFLGDNGHVLESQYPYTSQNGQSGSCRDTAHTDIKTTGSNYNQVSGVANMKQQLASGPMVVLLNGAAAAFQQYTGGIFDDATCTDVLDHAVLLTGWGSENGVPYWVIKNSWTSSWGEGGFIRIRMGINMCGVEDSAIRPIV